MTNALQILEQARYANGQIEVIDDRLNELEDDIAKYESRAEGNLVSKANGMPGGGRGSDWTYTLVRAMELRDEYKQLCNERKELRACLGQAKEIIDGLMDGGQRTVLRLYYLRNKKWAEVAGHIGVDVQTVYRWRDAAYRQLEKNIFQKI